MTEIMTLESTNGGPDESPYPGDYIIVESGSLDDLKGPLRRSARLRFTCMDVSSRYIALGSNTGSVYVFDRNSLKHLQVVFTDMEPSPVNVVAICPANKSVAFSTTNGYVNVMEMNIERRQKPDKLRIVTDHLHTTVTCLQWDGTGDKLFSADLLGKVVVSVIPVSKVKNLVLIPVEIIMKLDSAVVQLDWFSDRLLVSTTNKVCLCNTIKQQYSQVGKKPREGAYGSMFYINPSATVPLIYSARPGSRLWEVDFDGNVLNTHQFKQMLAAPPMTVVRIGNDLCTWTEPSKDPFPPQGINFPQLKMIGEQFVLSWRKSCLFIMDPANDVPSLILWAELDKDIHNISCVGTDIYIFYVNSEVQRLQFLTVTQCVSLLTKRKQWAIAAKICCYFETSILQMHHRAYLSTRSLSSLWEKMSMLENGKVMDALSRILFKYESEPRSESEEDRSSDNSVRSRSSSGASIKRLESGIYQIMAAKQGSNTNLQSLGADLKVSAESVIEKDTLLAIDTEKNGVKHVDSVPNGDASLLEVCNTENEHTEEVASENFKDVSLSDDQDVLEYSSPICGSQGEDDKVGEIGNSSQVLMQFVVGQEVEEPYNDSQSSHPNISEPIEMMQTEEQEIVPEKGDLVSSFSSNALETEGDKTEEHTRKELLSEETQPIAEKDLNQEMTQDDIDINSVKTGMEPSVEQSLDEKPKIEINPMINAVDIFAEDTDVGIVSKKSPKKKKKGKTASTSSKEKKSISAVVDLDDKSQGEFTQIDHNNESSEMSKLSSDPTDPSQTLECTHQVNEENVTKGIITNDISELNEETREFTSDRGSVLDESTEEHIPDMSEENSSVLNESKGIPTQDESTEEEELLTARQFSVSIEELITSFESGSTEMASISDYEDNDTTVKAPGNDGLSTEKDTKETADLSPLIARGVAPFPKSSIKKKKAAAATIVNLDDDNRAHRITSQKEKRSYKRIQSFGSASIDVVKKSGMKKRSSIPDLFKMAEQQRQDVDQSKGDMGSSPSDSPLTQSWEGPDTPTSPKMSLMAVREKVQSKLTNTKNKILKTIKESNILQGVPNEDISITVAQMDEVESRFSQSPSLAEKKVETVVHHKCPVDLSDLRASTDQSKRALQNPRVLLDAELSKEVLSKWVVHLHTALQQLQKLLHSQKLKLAKKSDMEKGSEVSDKSGDHSTEITDASNVEITVGENSHPEGDTEVSSVTKVDCENSSVPVDNADREQVCDDSVDNTDREQVCDDGVPDPALDTGCPIYVSDPFYMDGKLRKNVSELAQMCFSVNTYGAISEFLSIGAKHSRTQYTEQRSLDITSHLNHSHITKNTDVDIELKSSVETQTHRDMQSDVKSESELNRGGETQSGDDETSSLHYAGTESDLPESLSDLEEILFIRCYFFLLNVEDIQDQIYKNESWDQSGETKNFYIWRTLLECLQERCKGDTICDKILGKDIKDALDMLKSGLYNRENSLGYLSTLFEVDPSAGMEFAVDCRHIEPLDILHLCVHYNMPTKVHLHQYMCSLNRNSSKLPLTRQPHFSRVVYPVTKEWLQILLTMDCDRTVLSDTQGNPRYCSHKSIFEHGTFIQSILSASSPSHWQLYLDMCTKHGYWIGCLAMLKNLKKYDDMLKVIYHLGDISLVSHEYYLPCSEEEWIHFVSEYSKFCDQFSRVQRKSTKTSEDSVNRDVHDTDHDVSQKPGSGVTDLSVCQDGCMSWIDVADLIVQKLGVMKSVKILGQFTGEMDGLSTEFYQKLLTSAMIEKHQRNVSHNLVEKIDSYLWAQKPNCLMPQLQYAVSTEKLSGRSDQDVQSIQDIKMTLRNDSMEVYRYREDYECHWGVVSQMSKCRVCNLPLTEAVSHIIPGILVFPCGHVFHRLCCSEQSCIICF